MLIKTFHQPISVGKQIHFMARSRYKFMEGRAPHFLTITVVNWIPLFSSPNLAQIVLDSLTFMQKEERMTLYAYSILENHLHLNAAALDLSKQIGNFKSHTARQMIDFLMANKAQRVLDQLAWHKAHHKQDRDYQLWQEGSHPELIRGEEMMRQKIEYIHNNPVKRGYVDLPIHWRYSSARNYEGLEGLTR